jgi:hypothetical protein
MSEQTVTGVAGGGVGGRVNVSYGDTADASVLIAQSGAKVKELLDRIKVTYRNNVNNPDVWASKAAEKAYLKFEALGNKFDSLHQKIVVYSAGVKLVSETYTAAEAERLKKADEVLNSENV